MINPTYLYLIDTALAVIYNNVCMMQSQSSLSCPLWFGPFHVLSPLGC